MKIAHGSCHVLHHVFGSYYSADDEMIFPNSESSLIMGAKNDESCDLKRAMELLAADSEEEDDQMEDQDGTGRAGHEATPA